MSRRPMPEVLEKRAKATAGRIATGQTPLALRTHGVGAGPDLRAYVRDRAGRKIGKHAEHVERVTVRFEDVNGPRGGVDTVCRIKVVLSGFTSVVVEERATDARQAFDAAVQVAARSTARELSRARTRGGRARR